ncbi:MAG: protein kinase [candidate division Zixibacteria bacterium]|nr:protein kinase [candidate division Zixibacteria bacterium]
MLEAGQTFAHFKIMRPLGAGGMGEVYLAEDQKLHREVAIKILLADYFDDAERLQRFEREAKTAAQISHANAMGIFDMGTTPHPTTGKDVQYIVMERVHGVPLFEFLKERQLSLGRTIRIAEKIASGLSAAHKLNIVHRDIKSTNILVDDEGNPKILDFGLAKPIDPVQMGDESTDTVSQELTKAGKIVGTISYMSPEQARGEKVDARSDLFSFGVLVYHMVGGDFPFSGPSQVATLAKILEAKHVPLPNVPPELQRILDKCLQKDPSDRYQSAADLVVDLRNLRRQVDSGISDSITGLSSVSGQAVKQVFVSRLSGRAKLWSIVGVVFVIALIVAIIDNTNEASQPVIDTFPVEAIEGDALAVLSFKNKTGDPEFDWMETGLPEILTTDLAQSATISVISRERILDYLNHQHRTGEIEGGEGFDQLGDAISQAVAKSLEGVPGAADALKEIRAQARGKSSPRYDHAAKLEAARTLGATNVLSGSFYKMGDKIRIDARLEDIASGQIVLGEKVVGSDPFALVDSLTIKIVASLNISGSSIPAKAVASMVTSSPEAYRLYLEGQELFHRNLFEQSIEKYNLAIQIDPAFAMAYMRLGVSHVFSGHQQEGAVQFALAQEYKSKLPIREKSLLDVYSDIWLVQEYDAAFVKLAAYVDNYPDDKEVRSLYGITLRQFNQDTVGAFAQWDTVLATDPGYQWALSNYAQSYRRYGNPDLALVYLKRLRQHHPDSPEPYRDMGALYREMGRIDEAIAEYELAYELFPEKTSSLTSLGILYIRKRQFSKAAETFEKFGEAVIDNPYQMTAYYAGLANLANWEGKFIESRKYLLSVLEEAHKSGDSGYVAGALQRISDHYLRFDMADSTIYYSKQSSLWERQFRGLNYCLQVVAVDPSRCGEVRQTMESAVTTFKESMPAGLWPLVDAVEKLFEAGCAADTVLAIAAMQDLMVSQGSQNEVETKRGIGVLMIHIGDFQAGKELIQDYLTGPRQGTSGYSYPLTLYMMGRANEGLGNTAEAIKNFEEMLKYWSNPEIETKEIKDARERLARLTS